MPKYFLQFRKRKEKWPHENVGATYLGSPFSQAGFSTHHVILGVETLTRSDH